MNDIQFLNWVALRVGPVNAINLAHSTRLNALIELLVNKKIIDQFEVETVTGLAFKKAGDQVMGLPIISPIQQNRP